MKTSYKIIILIGLFSFEIASACKALTPKMLNLGISTDDNRYFAYEAKSLSEEVPHAEVNNCQETSAKRKFLMVAVGPEVVEQTDSIRGTNFNKEFNSGSCKIANNPLSKILDVDFKRADFNNKWNFISKCLEIQVTENGSRPIAYPLDQEGCKVTVISPKTIVFNGGYCFVKPSSDSKYNISYSISKTCLALKGYSENQIDLQDLNLNMSFYTSTTYKDDLSDLTAIGSMPVRISTNPVKSILDPSENFGIVRPTFPQKYPVSDINLGKIQFTSLNDTLMAIKVPFIVDNSCKTISKSGVTSSLCNYSTPVVGEINLKDEKGVLIKTWDDGGVAPARWQGILEGEGTQLMKGVVEPNKSYEIEVNFSDPYYDFNIFKGRVQSRIGLINARLPLFNNDGSIRDISEVDIIKELDDMLTVDPVSDLNFQEKIVGLANGRRRLSGFFSTNMWPPMYEEACNPVTGACAKVGKSFVKITAKFKLDENYNIINLKIKRQSDLIGSYEKVIQEQPEFICE
jgi:hypothetical protein